VNIIDDRGISAFLEGLVRERTGEASQAAEMLGVFMPNVLKKIPELFEEITNYPEDPPAWLTKDKFENAGPFHAFAPERLVDNSRLKEQIDHVADWVVGACRRDAPWLKDTDARGYPKKFGKIGTL